MLKLVLGAMIFSVLMLASFSQNSFGFENNDLISEWGSFGIVAPGHFSHPQFIAVGDDGSIYVSDFGNKRIQKFSSNGEYVTEWGKSGKQAGEFHYPSGIAVSEDHVFVADRNLNKIQKFTTDGEFISEWGMKGSHEGQLYFPNGIAVKNGTIHVVDTGNQRIQKFTTDGVFISSFGSSGLGEGQFLTAVGIDIDDDGNIFVADKGSNKIEKFDSDGEFVKSFAFRSLGYDFSPESLVIDPYGDMFIVNSANGKILHLSQNSSLTLDVFDKVGPYHDSFKGATDIAIGINGELLIVDSTKHMIKSFETQFYQKPLVDSVVIPKITKKIPVNQTLPIIIAPNSITVEAKDLLTVVPFGEAVAIDKDGIKAIINNASSAFTPGVTAILWTAFDNLGYSSNTTQIITVNVCGNALSGYNLIEGTLGNDILNGTDGNDLIFGLAGDDVISAGLGDDCIFGGHGNDVISGGHGNDILKGNAGNDILKGGSGVDIIYAGSGSDVLDGGLDNDRCHSDGDQLLRCEAR